MTVVHQVRGDALSWRDVEDEIVVLDLRGSAYFSLNGPAALLWKQLVGGASSESMADRLVAEFDIDRATATEDVADLVDRLRELDLLE